MTTFSVTVVREAGTDPLSGKIVEAAQESLTIQAKNEHDAYERSQFMSSLPFMGQLRRTFIDGAEYVDPNH